MARGVVILCLCLAAPALAQPASDLLQSGIFAQETAGDLDGAIRIYRQILKALPEMRLYAAQAQYRLGVCLLRKGDAAAGIDALQQVIRDYPDERDLVALARESIPRPGALLPAPWSGTEVAEYRWTIPGVDDGWSLTRIAPATASKNLRIDINFYAPRLYRTQVEVDGDRMRPVRAAYQAPSQPVVTPQRWRAVRTGGQDGPGYYEFGEVVYLLRRMPLYAGWTAKIPLMRLDGSVIERKLTATGPEAITVPAGTFQCLRVHLEGLKDSAGQYSAVGTDGLVDAGGESFWFDAAGAHALVKMQAGAATGELTSLQTGAPKGSGAYRDPAVGVSFTVPAGWLLHPRPAYNGPATSVDLLDPELDVVVIFSFKSKRTASENIEQELLAGAQVEQAQRPALMQHPDLKKGQIGGRASISWAGERDGPEGKIIRWTTWVQSESTRGSIAVAVPADAFDRFRRRFQPILDSLRMP